MKRPGNIPIVLAALLLFTALLAACAPKPAAPQPPAPPPAAAQPAPATVALGGKLYDNWMKTAGVATPAGNSPIWATQTTNKRIGADTWRCKECHGWDYKGKDGAYGGGSHRTGIAGILNTAGVTPRTK